MPYTVEWSPRAVEDLLTKVTTEHVARELHRVAEDALNGHQPPDGGEVVEHGTVYWRRGVLLGEPAPAASRRGGRPEASDEHAYDYIFVYHRRGRAGSGWYIIALFRMSEVAFAFGHTDVQDVDLLEA